MIISAKIIVIWIQPSFILEIQILTSIKAILMVIAQG